MLNVNITTRVFQMKCGQERGSCFTIDYEQKQYICTAKHCLKNFNGTSIELFHDQKWKTVSVKLVGHGSHCTDISVLATEQVLSPSLPMTYSLHGVVYSQDVYFLGFPFGLTAQGENINRQFPLPLSKKGILSAIVNEKNQIVLVIDGHNNPGFSGGPVVYVKAEKDLCVGGVISGYRFDYEDVIDDKGQGTGLKAEANTGIIIAHGIEHAIDAIKAKQIGVPIL